MEQLEKQLKALRPVSPDSKLRQKCFAAIESQKQEKATYRVWGMVAAIMLFLSIWSYSESVKIQNIVNSVENSHSKPKTVVKEFLSVGIKYQKTIYVASYKKNWQNIRNRTFSVMKTKVQR